MSECLECGRKTKDWASLCRDCLADEFKKMDMGIQTGYLYAGLEYKKKLEEDNG